MAVRVRSALREGRQHLNRHGIVSASLDAGLLLAHSMGTNRDHLLAASDAQLRPHVVRHFRRSIARRAGGHSVALIRGEREFYGRSFIVDRWVLIPRPETETLVEATLNRIDALRAEKLARTEAQGAEGPEGSERDEKNEQKTGMHVLDCCTGSGAVAITLVLERPELHISASDISRRALAVARRNLQRLSSPTAVSLLHSDLLAQAAGPYDIIVCNPPYLTSAELRCAAPEVAYEPQLALNGGPDGLKLTRRLATESVARLRKYGYLLVEMASNRAEETCAILLEAGFADIEQVCDLSGRPRVACARLSRRRESK